MAGTKEIKRRIKSVKSTKKITKAMELVAASKMKRAVFQALASRIYANYSWELLTSLAESLNGKLEDEIHPFFTDNENRENKSLIILITSNRGLCGGYNSQITKKVITMLKTIITDSETIVEVVTVGKKGDNSMRRVGQSVIATFVDLGDTVTLQEVVPLSAFITNEFKNGNYRKVYVAYTDFVSALNQKANIKQLLPIKKEELKELIENLGDKKEEILNKKKTKKTDYLFEGNINKLLDGLAEKLVRMQIYQMILESNASEQSSRMLAMKNANEAAGEMIDDLTLMFNKARQASITREISEISAGMASIS